LPQRNREQEAQLEEKRSLDALKAFVAHTCEVLGMWRILCEHQFHVIADMLSKVRQQRGGEGSEHVQCAARGAVHFC
jgi:hypothetical protein